METDLLDKRYNLEPITEEDRDNIKRLLASDFYPNEPVNEYLQKYKQLDLHSPASQRNIEQDVEYIADECSFKALNSNGEIIGFVLNGIIRRSDPFPDFPTDESPQWQTIMDFATHMDTKFNYFRHFPACDEALETKFVCVKSEYAGAGIGQALVQLTIEYMKDVNLRLYVMMCTSLYSAKVCEKVGMRENYKLHYADYVVNGETPLKPAAPHDAVRFMSRIV